MGPISIHRHHLRIALRVRHPPSSGQALVLQPLVTPCFAHATLAVLLVQPQTLCASFHSKHRHNRCDDDECPWRTSVNPRLDSHKRANPVLYWLNLPQLAPSNPSRNSARASLLFQGTTQGPCFCSNFNHEHETTSRASSFLRSCFCTAQL